MLTVSTKVDTRVFKKCQKKKKVIKGTRIINKYSIRTFRLHKTHQRRSYQNSYNAYRSPLRNLNIYKLTSYKGVGPTTLLEFKVCIFILLQA